MLASDDLNTVPFSLPNKAFNKVVFPAPVLPDSLSPFCLTFCISDLLIYLFNFLFYTYFLKHS